MFLPTQLVAWVVRWPDKPMHIDGAVPLWRSDLSLGNKVLEFIFPKLFSLTDMILCAEGDAACLGVTRAAAVASGKLYYENKLRGGPFEERVVAVVSEDDSVNGLELVILEERDKKQTERPLGLMLWIHGGGLTLGFARESPHKPRAAHTHTLVVRFSFVRQCERCNIHAPFKRERERSSSPSLGRT